MMLGFALSPLAQALRRASGAVAFDPATLFGVSDRGGVYDMTSSANVFQLSAGTGAVAVGDPVGYVADLGPFGRPALQATAVSRPSWAGVPRTLGPELVTNGRFATDTVWAKGTGWTINAATGRAVKAAGTASVLASGVALVAGKLYFLTYQITRTAGTVTPRLTGGTTVAGVARSYVGSWVEELVAAAGNTTLEFSADAAFAGSVGNVTCREVTSFVNLGVRCDGVDDFLQTANIDMSNSNKATLVMRYRRGQLATLQYAAMFGSYGAAVAGSFMHQANDLLSGARGSTGAVTSALPAGETTPISNYQDAVLLQEVDLAGATLADQLHVGWRGVAPETTAGGVTSGGGLLANGPFVLGKAVTTSGRLGGVIERAVIINRLLTEQEKQDVLRWVRRGSVYAAVLGDSTVSNLASNTGMPQAVRLAGLVGGLVCNAADISKAGDRIADQLAAWAALPLKAALEVVIVQIGLNDVKGRVGESSATTAQVITDYQNLINTINADKPSGCKVYVAQMTPCRTWLNLATNPAAAYAAWQDVNTAIAGGGATPITGVDGRITSHVAALAGASDILDLKYDLDGVHENNEARFIIAQAWRTKLEEDGLL